MWYTWDNLWNLKPCSPWLERHSVWIIMMTMQQRINRDLIESLTEFVGENLSLLAPVDQAWQPTDYLPDLTAENWTEQLERFRETALGVSDELLVILVGNMITEEALPNYSIALQHTARDPSGTTERPGHAGCEGGRPRRTGMATCSMPISVSRDGSRCDRSK